MEHNEKELSLYQHTSWASTLFLLPCVVWLPDLDGLDVAESHNNFVTMTVSEVSVLEKSVHSQQQIPLSLQRMGGHHVRAL